MTQKTFRQELLPGRVHFCTVAGSALVGMLVLRALEDAHNRPAINDLLCTTINTLRLIDAKMRKEVVDDIVIAVRPKVHLLQQGDGGIVLDWLMKVEREMKELNCPHKELAITIDELQLHLAPTETLLEEGDSAFVGAEVAGEGGML